MHLILVVFILFIVVVIYQIELQLMSTATPNNTAADPQESVGYH